MLPTDFTVLQFYHEGFRAYHDLNHPLELLELHFTGKTRGIVIPNYKTPCFGEFWDKEFVSGVIAHDCFYQVGLPKGENERRSLARWAQAAGRVGSEGAVKAIVLGTITHNPDDTEYPLHGADGVRKMVEQMIDLDLASLGAERAAFDINSGNVRKEFLAGGVDPERYDEGRVAFFKGMLERPTIYYTEQFKNALEEKARANMQSEIDRLTAK